MSRGLTDVPMIVVGNKTDLLRRDLASDKFRHDVINKVRVRPSAISFTTNMAVELHSLRRIPASFQQSDVTDRALPT